MGIMLPTQNLSGTLSRLRRYAIVPVSAIGMCKTASGEGRDFLKSVSLIPNIRKTREMKRNESNHIMLIYSSL